MALPRTLLQRWLEKNKACLSARTFIGRRTPIEVVTRTEPDGRYTDVDGLVRWALRHTVRDESMHVMLRDRAILDAIIARLRALDWRDAARLLPEPLRTIEKKMRQNRGERWGRH